MRGDVSGLTSRRKKLEMQQVENVKNIPSCESDSTRIPCHKCWLVVFPRRLASALGKSFLCVDHSNLPPLGVQTLIHQPKICNVISKQCSIVLSTG